LPLLLRPSSHLQHLLSQTFAVSLGTPLTPLMVHTPTLTTPRVFGIQFCSYLFRSPPARKPRVTSDIYAPLNLRLPRSYRRPFHLLAWCDVWIALPLCPLRNSQADAPLDSSTSGPPRTSYPLDPPHSCLLPALTVSRSCALRALARTWASLSISSRSSSGTTPACSQIS